MRIAGARLIGPVSKIWPTAMSTALVRDARHIRISRDHGPDRFIFMHANADIRWSTHETPVGRLTLVAGPHGLRTIAFPGHGEPVHSKPPDPGHPVLAAACAQLEEYFAGSRQAFDLPLDLGDQGTPFQRSVWRELTKIPFGATVSYGDVARAIGRLDRIRAVGGAVGRVPVPIVVPCHRVIGSSGDLVGYGGGLPRKRALLELEARVSGAEPLPALWSARQLALM
jgi:methylated-DNA-[protein]-cysteine S-methyltransferase